VPAIVTSVRFSNRPSISTRNTSHFRRIWYHQAWKECAVKDSWQRFGILDLREQIAPVVDAASVDDAVCVNVRPRRPVVE
jgi:hypothetical protein